MQQTPLILASTSPYRKALLQQLTLPFATLRPAFDEDLAKSQNAHLSPEELSVLLASEKAHSLATAQNCVIGGDQLVEFENRILGKPKNRPSAVEMLLSMSGKSHRLITSTCVIHQNKKWIHTDHTLFHMRKLQKKQIEKYIDLDQPFDCAGSYKIELHGMALFEKIETQDSSSIQGLPLLWLGNILTQLGYEILGE